MLLKAVLFAILATAAYARPGDNLHMKAVIIRNCQSKNVTGYEMKQVEILTDELMECSPAMITDELFEGLEEAQRQGTMESVVKWFCGKAPQMMSCKSKYANTMKLCKTPYYYNLQAINIQKHMVDYVCYEEDHKTRLAKIIEDGAIQCFTSREQSITECWPHSIYVDSTDDLRNMSVCVTENMKACSPSLGLQAEHLFQYVINEHQNIDNINTTAVTPTLPLNTSTTLASPIVKKLFNINIDAKISISMNEV